MGKLLTILALLVSPVIAQVNPLLVSKPMIIGGMTAPPAISKTEAGTRAETATPGRSLYQWSIAAVLAANVADVASSWRQQEANPVVGGGGTQFGATSVAIKTGFVATSLVIQHIALRHRPDLYKKMAWLNFGTSAVLGGVAKYNMGVR